jgi:DNA-binding MarR family transcriptional regulator
LSEEAELRPSEEGVGEMTEEDLAREILHCLRRLTHAMDQHSSALARRYGLTGPQLAVLDALSEDDALSISALARRVSLSQPTVTGIVKRMLARGLLAKGPSLTDGRVSLLSLTPHGRRVLDAAPPLLRQPFKDRLSGLGEWEQAQLLESLRLLVSMIEEPPFPPGVATMSGGDQALKPSVQVGSHGDEADSEPF